MEITIKRYSRKMTYEDAATLDEFWVSSPVIKCKKTPRKKCSFVAEVKGKR